jgi:aminoglycoside 6'-N-acetyltransferase I
MSFSIRRATAEDKPDWLRMRQGLWPDAPVEYLNFDMDDRLADTDYAVFVASREDGQLVGFLEAGTRKFADGCETSPVGYIEGWYVSEGFRGKGIGAELVRAAEEWARSLGRQEMASDTWLENENSIRVHRLLGYEEMERLVHFVKRL